MAQCAYCQQDADGNHQSTCPRFKWMIGWVCPNCGAVWSPLVTLCVHCVPLKKAGNEPPKE